MKKSKKLVLNREVIRSLTTSELGRVAGGITPGRKCSEQESGCNLSCEENSCLPGSEVCIAQTIGCNQSAAFQNCW